MIGRGMGSISGMSGQMGFMTRAHHAPGRARCPRSKRPATPRICGSRRQFQLLAADVPGSSIPGEVGHLRLIRLCIFRKRRTSTARAGAGDLDVLHLRFFLGLATRLCPHIMPPPWSRHAHCRIRSMPFGYCRRPQGSVCRRPRRWRASGPGRAGPPCRRPLRVCVGRSGIGRCRPEGAARSRKTAFGPDGKHLPPA